MPTNRNQNDNKDSGKSSVGSGRQDDMGSSRSGQQASSRSGQQGIADIGQGARDGTAAAAGGEGHGVSAGPDQFDSGVGRG